MTSEEPPRRILEAGKKPAYLRGRMNAEDLDTVNRRLIVVLDDGKSLMIEQRGGGLGLVGVAKRLNIGNVLKALGCSPAEQK